jgi:malate/lactate dehydrogenase
MVKIALLGAAGQIGTPLSLLCKAVSPSSLTDQPTKPAQVMRTD